MKILSTMLFFCFFSIVCYAQLPDDFIAPDFTATDLNGEEHNLYQLLDEGKTVIIDIYATWCSPCWDFHEEHVLAEIWEELGPDGTDEVFVMSIESDLGTDINDLNGTSTGTQGNWIEGTPYPMINEMEGIAQGQIASDYYVYGYPTIYFICPSRTVTEIHWQNVSASYENVISNCPSTGLFGENNLNLEDYIGLEGAICENVSFSPQITFRNLGNQNITSATFAYTINGSTSNYTWTGDLAPYYTDIFEFPMVTASSTDIIFEVLDINNSINESQEVNVIEKSILAPTVTEMDTVTIEIRTDDYGAETYWAVLNENDEIIESGGNQSVGFDMTVATTGDENPPTDTTAYENNTFYSTDVYLPTNGCYRLAVTDYYLDGICCEYGNGYFKVISSDNGVLFDGTDPEFEAKIEAPFAYNGVVKTTDQFIADISTYPNPILNELYIDLFENKSQVQRINIYDLHGKLVYMSANNFEFEPQIKLDLSRLQSGFYLMLIKLEDGSLFQRKIVKT